MCVTAERPTHRADWLSRLRICATCSRVESVAPESLGQKIRNRRLELNLTQREVADAVGITVPYMSKIEAGKETPTDEKIARLATKLKLNPDELTLAAGRMPSDVMDRLVADPTRALEFMRKVRR